MALYANESLLSTISETRFDVEPIVLRYFTHSSVSSSNGANVSRSILHYVYYILI